MTTNLRDAAYTALTSVLGADQVRPATDADAIGPIRPQWIALVNGTQQAAAAMKVAAEYELRVVPRGSGSKMSWGAPADAADLILDLSPASQIIEHAAGDLVLHAQAGSTLGDIQRATSQAGQQLAVDHPWNTATIGGLIAAGAAGPSRHLYGSVRDLLIGITVVRADATVTTSGGKVVKNVAGYDLGKLYTGSFGTLGVITEAVFRLHPLAAEHRWISVAVDEPAAAARAVAAVRRSQTMPVAVELDWSVGAGPITICVHLDGQPSVTHRRALELADQVSTASGGQCEVLRQAPAWWGKYPFDPESGIGLRLGVEPAAVESLLAGAQEAAEKRGLSLVLRGAAGIGVINAGMPGDADPSAASELITVLRSLTAAYGGYAVVWRATEAVRSLVDPWGPIAEPLLNLMRRTKNQFDPEHRLAPGRFVGGI